MFHCTYKNIMDEVVLSGGPLSFCLRLCVSDRTLALPSASLEGKKSFLLSLYEAA